MLDSLFQAAVVEVNPNISLNYLAPIKVLFIKFAFYVNTLTALSVSWGFIVTHIDAAFGCILWLVNLYFIHLFLERLILKKNRVFGDTPGRARILFMLRTLSILVATIHDHPIFLVSRLLSELAFVFTFQFTLTDPI
jgi:hypothetical protein